MPNRDDSTVRHGRRRGQGWGGDGASEGEQRLAAAKARGEPEWLWPEVPVAAWRGTLATFTEIATAFLTGTPPPALCSPDEAAERALGVAAYTSGLGPWLGWHVERGALQADAAAGRVLRLHLDHSRLRWQRLSAALDEALGVLRRAGIGAVVLKGAHTARLCFPEPALRPMADLDVMVSAADFAAAERALAVAGWAENVRGRLQRPRRAEWRPADAPLAVRTGRFVHAEDPYALDLHGTLDIDFFGVRTVRFGEATGRSLATAPWLPPAAQVLAQPWLTVHLAVHASHGLHGLTLIRLVELALLLRREMRTAGNRTALHDAVNALDAARFAWPALALVERLAPGTVDAALLRSGRAAAPPRLRRIIERLPPGNAQRLASFALEERFMWGDGPREHLRRFGNMLLPTGTPGPWWRLARTYSERVQRLLHGRVRWRSRAAP